MCQIGYIYPLKNNLNRDCIPCQGIDAQVVGDRGTYSFVGGGDKCHQCPVGKVCDGKNHMYTEWGWWLSRGRSEDKKAIRQKTSEEYSLDKLPLNLKTCRQYMSQDSQNNNLPPQKGMSSKDFYDPAQCSDTFVDKDQCSLVPGCSCKTSNEGVQECKVWCESKDSFVAGVYIDECGLPIKITRCQGFERRVSCEDEFKKQMKELLDPEHATQTLSLQSQCIACRSNTVFHRRVVTLPVTIVQHPFKRVVTAHDTETGEDIFVDPLWLFEGGLEYTPHSMHHVTEDSGKEVTYTEDNFPIFEQTWKLEILRYKMPRAGAWDVDMYSAGSFARLLLLNDKSKDAGGELEFVTVAFLANDPRLAFLNKQNLTEENLYRIMKNTGSIMNTNSTNSTYSNSTSSMHFIECNVMAGYHGRMCRSCLSGFSFRNGKCARCANYAASLTTVLGGFVVGFGMVNLMVLVVVADAGSTSTASSLKRIALNHMQILSMISNINLNWSPNTKEFFAIAGAVSSVGEEMIQTGCILNAAPLSIR